MDADSGCDIQLIKLWVSQSLILSILHRLFNGSWKFGLLGDGSFETKCKNPCLRTKVIHLSSSSSNILIFFT